MKKSLMIGSALLLTTTAIGAAVATSEAHVLRQYWHEGFSSSHTESRPIQLAERGERERHSKRSDGRRHHDEDERYGKGNHVTASPTGPAGPNDPVPDNGLFNSKTRPKVEVQ